MDTQYMTNILRENKTSQFPLYSQSQSFRHNKDIPLIMTVLIKRDTMSCEKKVDHDSCLASLFLFCISI